MVARAERVRRVRRVKARPVGTSKRPLPGELAMSLEYLLVTFKEHRTVLADGTPVGVTNHVLMLPPGGYDITLDGGGTEPPDSSIDLMGTSIVRPMTVAFT